MVMRVLRDVADVVRDGYQRLILFLVHILPGRSDNLVTGPVRRLLLAAIGVSTGPRTQVSPALYVLYPGRVVFGAGCRIGHGFKVWNFQPLKVGDNLLASHGISIICGTHLTDPQRTNVTGPVTIGTDVWIGANVTIVGPCVIGDGAIIGANSFVTGTVDAGAVVAGSPARKVR